MNDTAQPHFAAPACRFCSGTGKMKQFHSGYRIVWNYQDGHEYANGTWPDMRSAIQVAKDNVKPSCNWEVVDPFGQSVANGGYEENKPATPDKSKSERVRELMTELAKLLCGE